jgi:hypothetical protein
LGDQVEIENHFAEVLSRTTWEDQEENFNKEFSEIIFGGRLSSFGTFFGSRSREWLWEDFSTRVAE